MSMFISKALRRAEVFLEQVDESVAQASRRLAVEGATGAVNDAEEDFTTDEEDNNRQQPQKRRASSIPTAESRARRTSTDELDELDENEAHEEGEKNEEEEEIGDGWGDDDIVNVDVNDYNVNNVNTDHKETKSDADTDPTKTAATASTNLAPAQLSKSLPQITSSSSVCEAPVLKPSSSSHAATTKAPSSTLSVPLAKTTSASKTATATTSRRASVPVVEPDFVQALQEENGDLRKELEDVEHELEESRRDRTKLVKNLKRMKEILSEMDESLRDKSVEARELNDQILNLKEELSVLHKTQRKTETKGKDELEAVQKSLGVEISTLKAQLSECIVRTDELENENERLKEALLKGHEVDLATADGARQEASQARHAFEAEADAHRKTRQAAKEREETLQEEAALGAVALASAQRKAEECTVMANEAKAGHRAAEAKLLTVTQARDAAFARIEDLEEALRLFERNEGEEAPGQREAKAMQQTVSELENALEAKNVELARLEGELEAMRAKHRRDGTSPRAPSTTASGAAGRSADGTGGSGGAPLSQEVELKMRHMADATLRKQAQLEVLRSENRALQHQLTTERKRTREAQAMAAAASSSRQSIRGGFRGILESGEDDRVDRMYGLRDGPLARFRTPRNWPKPLAKLITSLDRVSAQGLAFLRKEPLLRIVLIVYVGALHLFVYTLLHWHVGAVTGSADETHGRVASAPKSGANVIQGEAAK